MQRDSSDELGRSISTPNLPGSCIRHFYINCAAASRGELLLHKQIKARTICGAKTGSRRVLARYLTRIESALIRVSQINGNPRPCLLRPACSVLRCATTAPAFQVLYRRQFDIQCPTRSRRISIHVHEFQKAIPCTRLAERRTAGSQATRCCECLVVCRAVNSGAHVPGRLFCVRFVFLVSVH
jgi:hypothetical protein